MVIPGEATIHCTIHFLYCSSSNSNPSTIFWFETGTPTFLVKSLRDQKEYQFDHVSANLTELGSFDLANPVSEALLFQTGYLTIKKFDPKSGIAELGYPNREVENSLKDALLSTYREVFPKYSAPVTEEISNALLANDIPRMITGLNALISTIPYDHWKAESESIFHIILHLALTRLGIDIRSEVHSSHGRCDAVILTPSSIYVMELKLNGSAKEAIEQIKEKNYLAPYQSDPRKKISVGINFSAEKRMVEDYLIKNEADRGV